MSTNPPGSTVWWGEQGPPGRPGPQGDPGPPGDPAEILESLAPGEALTVDGEGRPASLGLVVSRDELPYIDVRDHGAVGDSTNGTDGTDDTAAIQAALDAAEAAGGGVVLIPAGMYRLTRQAPPEGLPTATGYHVLRIGSGVTLRGVGDGSHLILDPSSVVSDVGYTVLRLGTHETGASDVTIEDLQLTASEQQINGPHTNGQWTGKGSIWGIAARVSSGHAAHADRVTVRRCRVNDSRCAIVATKQTFTGSDADHHHDWTVEGCRISLTSNKAIEFGSVIRGRIAGNEIADAWDGPQVLHGTRAVTIERNRVSYLSSGVNVTHNATDIDIVGNIVVASPTASVSVAGGALFLRTEPVVSTSTIADIRCRGNVWRDTRTTNRRVLRIQTRTQVTNATYDRISFDGDVLDGHVLLTETMAPAVTSLDEWTFSGCAFTGQITTATDAALDTADVTFDGCRMRSSSGYSVLASGWSYRGCRIASALTIGADAESTLVALCRVTGGVADNGTGSVLVDNIAA